MTTTGRLRATAHPLRLQILSLLTGTELSAAEVARELGTTQANASYHLRVLAGAGLLEPAGEERIRGGVAKRYRHPWREERRPGPEVTADADLRDRQALLQAMAHELLRRGTELGAGQHLFVDAELWVTADVYAECLQQVRRASDLLHDAARPPRTPGTARVAMSAAMFTLGGPPQPPAPEQARR